MNTNDLSRDMRLVAATIGDEATRKLMIELGGMYVYIPKVTRAELAAALEEEAFDVKIVAAKYRVSQSKLYSILKEIRVEREEKRAENWAKEKQMSLFEEQTDNE